MVSSLLATMVSCAYSILATRHQCLASAAAADTAVNNDTLSVDTVTAHVRLLARTLLVSFCNFFKITISLIINRSDEIYVAPYVVLSWWRSIVVELSLSCARLTAGRVTTLWV